VLMWMIHGGTHLKGGRPLGTNISIATKGGLGSVLLRVLVATALLILLVLVLVLGLFVVASLCLFVAGAGPRGWHRLLV